MNKKNDSKFDFDIEKIIASITGKRSKKKSKVTRTKTKSQFSSTAWAVIYIFGALLTIVGIVLLTKSQISINEKQQTYAELQAQVEMQEAANNELEGKLEGSLDDYIEEYARDKLNMLKPGERVYINTSGE